MKTNNMIRILIAVMGVLLIFVSFQNCDSSNDDVLLYRIPHPMPNPDLNPYTEYTGHLNLIGAELMKSSEFSVEELTLCIGVVELLNTKNLNKTIYTLYVSREISLSDDRIELGKTILLRESVDAARIHLKPTCGNLLSVSASIVRNVFTSGSDLNLFIPVSENSDDGNSLTFDFRQLVKSVSEVGSEEGLDDAVLTLDASALPISKEDEVTDEDE